MKLVLGTMTFGESVFAPNVSEFVKMFLDAGYEELDTAYVYNEGNCEKLLGEVLPELGRPYKISTKVNPRITGKLDGEAAYAQLNESLERLGVSSVDTFFLHSQILQRRWKTFWRPVIISIEKENSES